MKSSAIPSVLSTEGIYEDPLFMLHAEIEMLVANENYLKKIAGATVLFISHLEYSALPEEAIISAATLDNFLNKMPDALMTEVLQLVRN